jgi:hypothetical protein
MYQRLIIICFLNVFDTETDIKGILVRKSEIYFDYKINFSPFLTGICRCFFLWDNFTTLSALS